MAIQPCKQRSCLAGIGDLPPLVAGRKLFNLPINLGVLSKQNSQHTSLSDRHHMELVLSQLVYGQYELPSGKLT